MSKYYKAEDVINTLADQWHFEATMEYPDTAGGIEEWKENARELFADLPTIEVSEDCISREQVIEAIDEVDWYYIGFTGELVHGAASVDEAWYKAEDIYKAIESLPSIAPSVVPCCNNEKSNKLQQELQQAEVTTEQSSMVGEWVEVVKRTEQYDREGVKSWAVIYQCPYCGFVLNAIENHTAQYNYCPNCGAKMKG